MTGVQTCALPICILWSIAGIWVLIKVFAFVQMIIAAKLMPGETLKNLFVLPWEKK